MSTPNSFRLRGSYNLAIGASSTAATQAVPFGITHALITVTTPTYIFVSATGTAKTAVADGSGTLVQQYAPLMLKVAKGDLISAIAQSGTGIANVTLLSP